MHHVLYVELWAVQSALTPSKALQVLPIVTVVDVVLHIVVVVDIVVVVVAAAAAAAAVVVVVVVVLIVNK